jgi:hypothetical protein
MNTAVHEKASVAEMLLADSAAEGKRFESDRDATDAVDFGATLTGLIARTPSARHSNGGNLTASSAAAGTLKENADASTFGVDAADERGQVSTTLAPKVGATARKALQVLKDGAQISTSRIPQDDSRTTTSRSKSVAAQPDNHPGVSPSMNPSSAETKDRTSIQADPSPIHNNHKSAPAKDASRPILDQLAKGEEAPRSTASATAKITDLAGTSPTEASDSAALAPVPMKTTDLAKVAGSTRIDAELSRPVTMTPLVDNAAHLHVDPVADGTSSAPSTQDSNGAAMTHLLDRADSASTPKELNQSDDDATASSAESSKSVQSTSDSASQAVESSQPSQLSGSSQPPESSQTSQSSQSSQSSRSSQSSQSPGASKSWQSSQFWRDSQTRIEALDGGVALTRRGRGIESTEPASTTADPANLQNAATPGVDAHAPASAPAVAAIRLTPEIASASESSRNVNLTIPLESGQTAQASVRERAGAVDVRISTPTAASAQRVSGEIDSLRQNLDAAGIRLGHAEVSYQPGSGGGQDRGSNNRETYQPPAAKPSVNSKEVFVMNEVTP